MIKNKWMDDIEKDFAVSRMYVLLEKYEYECPYCLTRLHGMDVIHNRCSSGANLYFPYVRCPKCIGGKTNKALWKVEKVIVKNFSNVVFP